ncbi:hypothetical protein, partial [Amycolatopsis pretoriensis]|uniref:hypothetical protein n=1 Tax=Amycolatopsis pretoriensis TaxID=218821 RepID=UPI001B80948B
MRRNRFLEGRRLVRRVDGRLAIRPRPPARQPAGFPSCRLAGLRGSRAVAGLVEGGRLRRGTLLPPLR